MGGNNTCPKQNCPACNCPKCQECPKTDYSKLENLDCPPCECPERKCPECNCPKCPECKECIHKREWPKPEAEIIDKFFRESAFSILKSEKEKVSLDLMCATFGFGNKIDGAYYTMEFVETFILGSIILAANWEYYKNDSKYDQIALVTELIAEWIDKTKKSKHVFKIHEMFEDLKYDTKYNFVYYFTNPGIQVVIKLILLLMIYVDPNENDKTVSIQQYLIRCKSRRREATKAELDANPELKGVGVPIPAYNPLENLPPMQELKDYYLPHLHYESTEKHPKGFDFLATAVNNILKGYQFNINSIAEDIVQILCSADTPKLQHEPKESGCNRWSHVPPSTHEWSDRNNTIIERQAWFAKKYGKKYDVSYMYADSTVVLEDIRDKTKDNAVVDHKAVVPITDYTPKEGLIRYIKSIEWFGNTDEIHKVDYIISKTQTRQSFHFKSKHLYVCIIIILSFMLIFNYINTNRNIIDKFINEYFGNKSLANIYQ